MTEHTGFIVAAFLVTGTVLVGLVVATIFDHRIQLRALARLSTDTSERAGRT